MGWFCAIKRYLFFAIRCCLFELERLNYELHLDIVYSQHPHMMIFSTNIIHIFLRQTSPINVDTKISEFKTLETTYSKDPTPSNQLMGINSYKYIKLIMPFSSNNLYPNKATPLLFM